MASQLRVDKIVPVDGAPSGAGAGTALGGGGGIIQVVSNTLTTSAYQNIDGGSSYDWDTLTCTITPKFSTSKIMITAMLSLVGEQNNQFYIKMKRSGSLIGGAQGTGSTGSRQTVTTGIPTPDRSNTLGNIFVQYLDSPSTTSATTYMFNITHNSSSQRAIYINKTDNDGNDQYVARGVSTMTVMEISA